MSKKGRRKSLTANRLTLGVNLSGCRLEIAHRRFVGRYSQSPINRKPRHVNRTTQKDGEDEKVVRLSHSQRATEPTGEHFD
jgi:hypothetical protein